MSFPVLKTGPLSTQILQKFKLCKDIEYVCLLHILEEVLPLVFLNIAWYWDLESLKIISPLCFDFLYYSSSGTIITMAGLHFQC